MKIVNVVKKVKTFVKSQNPLSIAIIIFLLITLPLFIWAILNQKFNIGKRASSGEPGVCVPEAGIITVTPYGSAGTCHSLQAAVDAVDAEGLRIEIEPGTYQIFSTVNIKGKSNLTITGKRPELGNSAVNLVSGSGGGWGILVDNSTGSIQWLSMTGGSSNGMLSIVNSQGFTVAYANLYSQNSHTMDIRNSRVVSVYNTEIQSSAGALEVSGSDGVNIANNKIHNSDNGISINDTRNIEVLGNLIVNNRERGLRTRNTQAIKIDHNSIINNALGGAVWPQMEMAGTITGVTDITNNLVAHGQGNGINVNTTDFAMVFQRNDFWNAGAEYVGVADGTGVNGNISEDPKVDTSPGANYCLMAGSPALWGEVSQGEYMGYIGPCSRVPTPTPPVFTPPPPATECGLCGGFAGILCQPGLTCKMNRPIHPDQSGICVKSDNSSNCGGTATPTPAPSTTPSPSPSTTPQTLSFLIKFKGVTDDSADGADVKVYLQTLGNLMETPPMPAEHQGNGIYKISFRLSSALSAGRYPLYLKGEKHIRARFCSVNSVLTRCLGSASTSDGILIDADGGTYDLTAYSLEPGDLYVQDGIADFRDFRKIITLMAKPTGELTVQDKLTADLNYDGYVDIRDAFLMRQSLSVRQDDF